MSEENEKKSENTSAITNAAENSADNVEKSKDVNEVNAEKAGKSVKQPEKSEKKDVKKKKSVGREIFEWVYTIAIAVAIALVIKGFIFDIVRVDGSSMYPTLVNNDRLIVTRLGYKPQQGDIIILDSAYKRREEYYKQQASKNGKDSLSWLEKLNLSRSLPNNCKKKYYVKRVIAVAGQTVDIRNGKVYVDDTELKESYANGITRSIDASVKYPITIGENMAFVMGDNREHSSDSRTSELGQVPYDAVLGKAQVRIWPFSSVGRTK